jgi:hypothetical protein
MSRAVCKYCGEKIQWIRTISGAMMPCEKKRKVIIGLNGKTYTGYETHYAHCPQADEARRAYRRKKVTGNANHNP